MQPVTPFHLLWLSLLSMAVQAETWQDQGELNSNDGKNTPSTALDAPLQQYRQLTLDEGAFREILANLSPAQVAARGVDTQRSIELPLPDGSFTTVTLEATETLAPDIAAFYPDIQTWKVTGSDGKVVNGVLDFTALGFHAMLEMANGDTVFIDPQNQSGERIYTSFSKRDNAVMFRDDWSCDAHNPLAHQLAARSALTARLLPTQPVTHLHTYRLAVAATGEYTAKNGGSAETAFQAIVTTINRVNQIYQRDLAIRLQLVSNTNLIYINPDEDPFDNTSLSLLMKQNQTNTDTVIGAANYDIGHVFSTVSGGRSYVGSVCSDGTKAQGASGLANPNGQTFDISYVAHELAHQFGALHTFNSKTASCGGSNHQADHAFEPGSGSTIMAYAGVCGSDNLQTEADPMFHSASITDIRNYAHFGFGASCATVTSLNNQAPMVNAGKAYAIPANTPFSLQGSATDADGDALTYSWEQIDTGDASKAEVDTGNNALIRTYLPSHSAQRSIPRLHDLMTNARAMGETLPSTSRNLNFRLNVRDGKTVAHSDTQLQVVDTGSTFRLTGASKTWVPSSIETLEWEVANTNQAPISCSQVDIALTSDQGKTFTTLAKQQPNSGSATVTLPNSLGANNYVMIKCSDNIFFALSANYPAAARTATGNTSAGSSSSSSASTSTTANTSSGGGGSMPVGLLIGMLALVVIRIKID
ncbi:reprolysin-like metallopeptidase [Thiolinea disciformis]|uniref:reprolysin-like metallopeptidase n=1 Tax=Thiolinea disciformis TaxID=125614 RepID=UPI00037731BF|nr:zinc-dependent metalloprotease family protein [Thiolinea disciformis]